jgi:hypothetical protein
MMLHKLVKAREGCLELEEHNIGVAEPVSKSRLYSGLKMWSLVSDCCTECLQSIEAICKVSPRKKPPCSHIELELSEHEPQIFQLKWKLA